LFSEKSHDSDVRRPDSSEAYVEKAQQLPHCPWSLTGVTFPIVLRSNLPGRVAEVLSVADDVSLIEAERGEYLLVVEEYVPKFEILAPLENERSTVVGTSPRALVATIL
jgi:hypothetical protein